MTEKILVVLAEDCSALTDELIQRLLPLFGPSTRERLENRPPAKLRQGVAAHLALVYGLHKLAGISPSRCEVEYQATGKPWLPTHEKLHISKAHSGELAGAAAGGSPLGLDIEKQIRYDQRFAEHICTEQELAALVAASERERALTHIFCGKEAWGKLLGVGLLGCRERNLTVQGENLLLCEGESLRCDFWEHNGMTCCLCSGGGQRELCVFPAKWLAEWLLQNL